MSKITIFFLGGNINLNINLYSETMIENLFFLTGWLQNIGSNLMGDFTLSYSLDGLSLLFIILTVILTTFCIIDIIPSNNLLHQNKELIICLLFLALFLILAFSTIDLLIFYIFFESVLIPMFLIIGIWGSRERKIRADYYFFLYTLIGSIFLFFCIFILFFEAHSTKFFILYGTFIPFEKECLLWIFGFIAFSIKIPMFPFHIWLPEAHVEAPTSGSVILAGLLLKLGGYGCIKIIIPILPNSSFFFFPIISVFCVVSVIYAV